MKIVHDRSLETKIGSLLSKMSLTEKVSLLSGSNSWMTRAIPRLNVPSLTMTDGPHGVRTCDAAVGRKVGPATWFPTGVSMAASWDPVLVRETAGALAVETRYYGCDILLGPCININRVPLNGRNFETFSEDPFLSGRLAVGYVKGMQDKGVGASVKHFACNNQETERMRGSSEVDERALREIYLPAFEAAVKEADPATVMCSYNRVNGEYASQNHFLLTRVLREEWGFKGAVISDWGATHSTFEPVRNGLDLEMPGPALYFGTLLENAVRNWQIEEKFIDQAARRVLRLVLSVAKTRSGRWRANTPAHKGLSRKLASSSMVLLKNENGILPLGVGSIRTLAVVGPNADRCPTGGGSSIVPSPYRISPLSALRKRLKGVEVLHERGCENFDLPPVVASADLKPSRGKGPGLFAQFYNNHGFKGKPFLERVEEKVDFWSWGNHPVKGLSAGYTLRYSGYFRVHEDGPFRVTVPAPGGLKVWINGKKAVSATVPTTHDEDPFRKVQIDLELIKGRWNKVRIEYTHPLHLNFSQVKLCAGRVSKDDFAEETARAVRLAARSDAAVVVVGYNDDFESEGRDRPDLDLIGRQVRLIEAVASVNPRTVVVVNSGSPIAMPWIGKVGAVLWAGYAGQETGEAVADILLGAVNPSGKLPVTFPKRLEDTPAYGSYPGGREVPYPEGVFMGYRWYDRKGLDPLFCFGHGLSYTSFEFSRLSLPSHIKKGRKVPVSLTLTNRGGVPGAEVVQVYVGDPKSSVERPPKELKGFAKVFLEPGQSKRIAFRLDERALSFFHPGQKRWIAEPGNFTVEVGSSSRDIRLKGSFKLIK